MRSTILIAGVAGSFVAVACGEGYAFSQPSDAVCEFRKNVGDFGPPKGCGRGPGEHVRGFTVTALSTGTVTGPPSAVINVWDSEYVRLDHFPAEYSRSSRST